MFSRLIIFIAFILLLVSCNHISKNTNNKNAIENSNKIVVINFWSIFCLPCLQEFPQFSSLNNFYADNKIVSFYGLALNSEDEIKQFLSKDTTDLLGNIYSRMNFNNSVKIIPYYFYSSQINPTSDIVIPDHRNDIRLDSLTLQYKIKGIPTTIVYFRGKEVKRVVGFSEDYDYYQAIKLTIDSLFRPNYLSETSHYRSR